ncbi:hypothetical protein BGZ63DRAFT_404903 [Mariannaea sp. PMI_226]|nr:hypothetical protein BGZ63DRAFT_404903 [Mariannaea sp. PMI_226]
MATLNHSLSPDENMDPVRELAEAAAQPQKMPTPDRGSSPRRQSTAAVPGNVLACHPIDPKHQEEEARHVAAQQSQRLPKPFACDLCSIRYTRAYELRRHLRAVHADERSLVCTVCGSVFTQLSDRKRHEARHNGGHNLVCKGDLEAGGQWGCGRRFATTIARQLHFESESGRICIRPRVDEITMKRERASQNSQLPDQPAVSADFPRNEDGNHLAGYQGLALPQFPTFEQLSSDWNFEDLKVPVELDEIGWSWSNDPGEDFHWSIMHPSAYSIASDADPLPSLRSRFDEPILVIPASSQSSEDSKPSQFDQVDQVQKTTPTQPDINLMHQAEHISEEQQEVRFREPKERARGMQQGRSPLENPSPDTEEALANDINQNRHMTDTELPVELGLLDEYGHLPSSRVLHNELAHPEVNTGITQEFSAAELHVSELKGQSRHISAPRDDRNNQQPVNKDGLAFTESGYASAPNQKYSSNSQTVIYKTHEEDEIKTVYSAATTILPEIAKKSVLDVCNDIYSRIERHVHKGNTNSISRALPNLVKAFALKLGTDTPDEMNLRAMLFVYKHHQDIAAQVRLMLPSDETEPVNNSDTPGSMSLEEKMSMWGKHSAIDSAVKDGSELFEGVVDDDDDDSEMPESREYSRMIINSSAYEWFIASLIKEFLFHWDASHPRIMVDYIRQKILTQLPAGKISKKRAPCRHKATFEVPWHPSVRHFEGGTSQQGAGTPRQKLADSIVATCSSTDQVQLTTVKQYMHQTWPSGEEGFLEALQDAIDDTHERIVAVTLPDNTEIKATVRASSLLVSLSSSSHSIAERGEQLSWLGMALTQAHPQLPIYSTPCLKCGTGSSLKEPSESYWVVDAQKQTVGDRSYQMGSFQQQWLGALNISVIVRGFPTLLRPEGCLGVEVSPEVLFRLFDEVSLDMIDGSIIFHGVQKKHLQRVTRKMFLFNQITCVLFWHMPISANGICHCRHGTERVKRETQRRPSALAELWEYRHIIGDCNGTNLSLESRKPKHQLSHTEEPAQFLSDLEQTLSPSSSFQGTQESNLDSQIVTDSIDSDILSITNSSEEGPKAGLTPDNPIIPIIGLVARRLISGYRTAVRGPAGDISESNYNQAISSSSGHPQSTQTVASATAQLPNSLQLKRTRPENGQSEDEDSTRKPKRKRIKRHNSDKNQQLLACPFWKLDPSKHCDCFRMKMDTASRVKQHLVRNHTPDFYCPGCLVIFPEEEVYLSHVRNEIGTCKWDPSVKLDGITHKQRRELSRKSKPGLSDVEKWFAIWDIVFPNDPRPSSPYVDLNLSEEMCALSEYYQSQGPAIFAEEIRKRNVISSEADAASGLQMAIAEAVRLLNAKWLADREGSTSSPSGSSRNGRNTTPRRAMLNSAPPSSFADSGLGVIAQASVRSSAENAFTSPMRSVAPMLPQEGTSAASNYQAEELIVSNNGAPNNVQTVGYLNNFDYSIPDDMVYYGITHENPVEENGFDHNYDFSNLVPENDGNLDFYLPKMPEGR